MKSPNTYKARKRQLTVTLIKEYYLMMSVHLIHRAELSEI